jgi:hypothetical protein
MPEQFAKAAMEASSMVRRVGMRKKARKSGQMDSYFDQNTLSIK